MRPRLGLFLAFAWTTGTAPSAHAVEPQTFADGAFALEMRDCPRVSPASVRRILTIEIGDLLLGADDTTAGHDRLTIRCAGEVAWIGAAGQADKAPVEQIMRLDDFPGDAAPRALALAGLELLAAMNATVRARMAGRQNAPQLAASTAVNEPASLPAKDTRESHIGLAGTWRTFLSTHGPSTWGGQLQARSSLGPVWQVTADMDAVGGRTQVPHVGETSAFLLSSAVTLGVYAAGEHLVASLGAGVRFGGARLSGSSTSPANVTGATVWHPWGGPAAMLSAFARLRQFTFTLTAEAGRSLLQTDGLASGATVIAVGGTWVALFVGGGFRL